MSKLNNTVLVLGGDGYLGWSLALALANRTDDNIIIVDNLIKRRWECDVQVQALIKLSPPEERIKEYRRLYKRSNMQYVNIDLTDYESVSRIVAKFLPKTIINAAQQPSAPFSMMSPENAQTTFNNNSTTNLNVVWAIAATNIDIRYITLGSAGTYLSIDADFIPKAKVDLNFKVGENPYKIMNSWLPMQASDIYHQSKINSFLLNDLCTNLWGTKTITVQQSTIFGHTIPENKDRRFHSLSTRFNYDHIFGTVLNRFVCQAVIGHPLTVYGDGSQTTGTISLSDTIDNILRLCDVEIGNGEHLVEHNYVYNMSINDMANHLFLIAGIDVLEIENPRFEPKSLLRKKFENTNPAQTNISGDSAFLRELNDLYEYVLLYRKNINEKYILPEVNWAMPNQENDVTELFAVRELESAFA